MRTLYIVFTILLLSFWSCKPEEKKNKESEEVKKEVVKQVEDKFASFPKDVFYAKDDCVLFLQPSKEYFNEKLKGEEGIEEVASDAEYYANEFYKTQKDKRKIYFVTQRIVALINSENDTTLIDRYNKDLIYGAIIQQKDSVQILEGVQTTIDLEMALGIFDPKNKIN
ncbi:hypothetical protein WH52_10060 [Tenacibaculum holothuriorum]|uniref:Uncharacterized protein n=1 Tax=Tenacibaculum holothuriorum TaxID=1635173 RepID=A0A1Y2PBB9_9FLAO|nr:hypothetical protein [Tenacibaculum holothuriorum]OSY87763.1 hypothetical protein WH52_10060 [Tenacibaculum holothuriorum]